MQKLSSSLYLLPANPQHYPLTLDHLTASPQLIHSTT